MAGEDGRGVDRSVKVWQVRRELFKQKEFI